MATRSDAPVRQTVALPGERPPVAVLRRQGERRQEFLIRAGISDVGARPPSHLIIDEGEISSNHARILCKRGETGAWVLILVDRNSTNGTFVNGQRTERCELRDGDRVRFGNVEFAVSLLDDPTDRQTILL